jgi:hypothetical protein
MLVIIFIGTRRIGKKNEYITDSSFVHLGMKSWQKRFSGAGKD